MFMAEGELKMIKIILLCLICCLNAGAVLAEGDLDSILGGIQKNYGDLPGLTLSYQREVITKSMSMMGGQIKGDLASGRMYFKPPNLLRLEQETPRPETVISNEETLWWYQPDKKCVYKYPAKEFGKEMRLLCDIFRGLIKVEERFEVKMLDRNQKGENQIGLTPNPPWESIDRIILTVSDDNKIRLVGIHYQLGGVTMFTLNDVSAKKDFEEDYFSFSVPEGVTLIEENK